MKKLPFLLRCVQGAIGKRLVIKHYRDGKIVVTRYPDMAGILPSPKQQHRRRLFKKAVAYAQKIFASPTLREEGHRRLRRPRRLFQALVKEWLQKHKEKECWRKEDATTGSETCKSQYQELEQQSLVLMILR